MKKKTYIDYVYKHRVLLGYKFRLAGRFRRKKRQRSLVHVRRGMLPVSSHSKKVDYGQFILAKYLSTYSVRVWLNRNPNYKHKYFFKL